MTKKYYFFYLEVALKDSSDSNIYGFENVSHIPTSKLIEIFNIDLEKDPQLTKGYFLNKANYQKHKQYILEAIGSINLKMFEYCLRQYCSQDYKEVRKLYKEDLME